MRTKKNKKENTNDHGEHRAFLIEISFSLRIGRSEMKIGSGGRLDMLQWSGRRRTEVSRQKRLTYVCSFAQAMQQLNKHIVPICTHVAVWFLIKTVRTNSDSDDQNYSHSWEAESERFAAITRFLCFEAFG